MQLVLNHIPYRTREEEVTKAFVEQLVETLRLFPLAKLPELVKGLSEKQVMHLSEYINKCMEYLSNGTKLS